MSYQYLILLVVSIIPLLMVRWSQYFNYEFGIACQRTYSYSRTDTDRVVRCGLIQGTDSLTHYGSRRLNKKGAAVANVIYSVWAESSALDI